MISDTEFEFIKPKRNFYTQNEVQPSVGDSGAPVFAYKHPRKNKTKKKDKDQEVSHAFLVGVTSVSQFLAEQSQRPKSDKREWMSEQVMLHWVHFAIHSFSIMKMVSRVWPILGWISNRIKDKPHVCIEKLD